MTISIRRHLALSLTIKSSSRRVLREIFRSRIAEENVWDSGFGILDSARTAALRGCARASFRPRLELVYTCGAYVYSRESIANCRNTATTEGLTEGERQKNEMIELRLIAACCSSSINRTRTRTKFTPVLPNFANPAYCRCPFAIIVLEVEVPPPRRRRMHDHENIARLRQNDFLNLLRSFPSIAIG